MLDTEKNVLLKNMTSFDRRILKKIELFLLKQLDKDDLDLVTSGLSDNQKEVLYIYFGYCNKNKTYIYNDYLYQIKKEQALDYIRNKITEEYVINNKNEDITNYLDYLMYYYLNKSHTKTRTR